MIFYAMGGHLIWPILCQIKWPPTLDYHEQERSVIETLAKKLDDYDAAYKKWDDTVTEMRSTYDAKYQRVKDHNDSIETYWDYSSGEYKTSGNVWSYPKEPIYPNEPKFPVFTPEIKTLEALQADCAEISNTIDDLEVPQNKYYEDFEAFKKYMVRIEITLSGQVEDLTEQFKDNPTSFDKAQYDNPRFTADINTLKERVLEFATENKLMIME